ncbi:MAG: hypothetical protein ACYTGN_06035 [Planctomycetota bacterium]
MKTIDAGTLRDCTLESPIGTTRTKAILPFFTADLETKWLLVVLDDDSLVVVKEKPTGLVSRALSFPKAPRLRKFKHVQVASLKGLKHYDPWWLLKDRKDIPDPLRKAAIATNIAKQVEGVRYDAALAAVAGARVGSKDLPRRRLAEAVA